MVNPIATTLNVETAKNPCDYFMQFFSYDHISDPGVRCLAKMFFDFAAEICAMVPDGEERTKCLRSLLDSKDHAYRVRMIARS